MLLAEELVLLGVDPVKGTVVNQGGQALRAGQLRDTYAELASGRGRRTKAQLRRLDRALGGVWPRVVDGLAEQHLRPDSSSPRETPMSRSRRVGYRLWPARAGWRRSRCLGSGEIGAVAVLRSGRLMTFGAGSCSRPGMSAAATLVSTR